MKLCLMLVFIPCLITADILCPNSKTTCSEEKQCCEVDGGYSCCDPDDHQDTPARRVKVFSGAEFKSSITFAKASFSANETKFYGTCDMTNCPGTCCSNSFDDCCEYPSATCCGGNTCCPSLNKCCSNGCCGAKENCCDNGCCDDGYICCGGNTCCPSLDRCCNNGCCGAKQNCCGDGCCDAGYICCKSWCCKEGSKCGLISFSCRNMGVAISPEIVTLLLLVASVFVSHRF